MNTRLYALLALLLVLIGVAIGRYSLPTKVVVKTVIERHEVTRIAHDVQTVTNETTKPDGTKTVTTVVTDKSKEVTNETDKETQVKITENYKPLWKASVQVNPDHPELYYFYGVSIEHRFIGPLFVGAFGNMDKSFGLSVGVEL